MKHENETKNPLDLALEAYRGNPESPQRLSDRSRAAILQEATHPARRRSPAASLFPPVRLLALAGVVPVLLAVCLISWMWVGLDSTPLNGATPGIRVAKVGQDVIFTIENGDREHVVSRSLRPDRFDRAGSETVTEGTFRDRLDSGPDLVFYQID